MRLSFAVSVELVHYIWFDFFLLLLLLLGLYLAAALFGGYEQALLRCTGPQIEAWIDHVACGDSNWYRLLPLGNWSKNTTDNITTVSADTPNNWKAFIRGWLQATTG